MFIFKLRLPLRLQGIPRVNAKNPLDPNNGHEDIGVRDISNEQLIIWPGARLVEINRCEAEAS